MESERPLPVVTLSASYGAGGSEVGPRLATRLGIPFLDRAIASDVQERLELPAEGAEGAPGTLERLLRSLSTLGALWGADLRTDQGEASFVETSERVIREHVASHGGVVLGRGGAIVLADHPEALHVRLTGPVKRRVAQAMRVEGVDRETAERRLAENDAARDAFLRHFYDARADDAGLYHLVIDATAIPVDCCVELIATAANALRSRTPASA